MPIDSELSSGACADIIWADSVFSGISTFGRLPYYPCLASDDVKYDIAFIGTSSIHICSIEPNKVSTLKLTCRCPIRYRNFIPPRCPIWTIRNPSRFSPSQFIVRLHSAYVLIL
jgi:hypothetical protein